MKKIKFFKRLNQRVESIIRFIFLKIIYLKKFRNIDSPQTILIWSPGGGGWPILANLEMIIAAGLKMRGHIIKAVLFDNSYKAYSDLDLFDDIDSKENYKVCKLNLKSNKRKLFEFGIEYILFGEYLNEADKKVAKKISKSLNFSDLDEFQFKGVSAGKNIKASMIRYLKGKDFNIKYKNILSEYAYAGILNIIVAEKVISSIKPDKVFMSHAIYADWGPAMKCFFKKGIPTVTYASGYKTGFFNFKHVKNPNKIQVLSCEKETWNKTKNTKLTNSQKNMVNHFLLERYFKNSCADIQFHNSINENSLEFKKRYQIENDDRPIWSIFTHITWDASNENWPQIYPDYSVWLEKTIDIISKNKEVLWLIKIHPADLKNISPYNLTNRIKKLNLPSHIKVIKANDKINPYNFLEIISGGITSVGTSGLELALNGKPVILAGDSHYSGKDFTIDCKDENEYISKIMNAQNIKKLSSIKIEKAYRYAYLFFFRKQIKLPLLIGQNDNYWSIKNKKLLDLIPNKEHNISFVCDSFLSGKDFVI